MSNQGGSGKWVKGQLPAGAAPPIKKGEVRNPHGRGGAPEGVETKIKRYLGMIGKVQDPFSNETDPKKKPVVELSYHDLIIVAQIKKAWTGDTAAAEWLHSRAYGKMIQQTAVSVNAGHNLRYESLESTADFLQALKEIEEEEKELEKEYGGDKADLADFEEL